MVAFVALKCPFRYFYLVMASCQEKFNYSIHQKDLQSQFHTIGGVVSIVSIIINVFTVIFIIKHPQLRQKYICSFVLCLYNTAECLFSLIGINYIKYQGTLIPNVRHFRFFFLIGQLMSIGFILVQRIRLASGTGRSVSHITRNPSAEKQKKLLFVLNFLGFITNILLALFLVNYSIIVISIYVIFDLMLYGYLITWLSKLQSSISGVLRGLRKKALVYVSILLLGFLLQISITLLTREKVKDQLMVNCPPKFNTATMSVMCIYSFRFLWNTTVYFIFNGQPRILLREKCKRIVQKINCCKTKGHQENAAAVIPREEMIQLELL